MKPHRLVFIAAVAAFTLLAVGCEREEKKETLLGEEVHTDDITATPQFFSFSSGEFVSTYDLTFSLEGTSYLVSLNSAAGVQALADTSADFDTSSVPLTGFQYDTTGYRVIGDSWVDLSTYNPADHSVQGNGTVYFVWSASYEWVKLQIVSASPSRFVIRYAVGTQQGIFGDASIDTVTYASGSPAYYDFTSGGSVEPASWDLGLISVPVYAPGVGTFYMPSLHLNYDGGVKVAILEDAVFDDLLSVPADVTWREDLGELRNLGYGGPYEVLVYHPEPPYNHRVIVEHPDWVYIIETGGEFYKVRFLDYSSGVVLFEYARL
ncbi:MAG: hypothetical protein ACE5LH_02925 [Fidelibacterota bacterium]